MSQLTLDQLRERVRGEIITPDDEQYDEARKVYNGMIDRRPRVVVRAADAGDVMAAVDFARENELDLSVRGGAHSVPGFGTNDDGVVIDLVAACAASASTRPSARRAPRAAPPGATSTTPRTRSGWRRPAASSRRPASAASRSAAASATSRAAFGLSIDNLLSADVVTADGRLLVASEQENADLFWALRGGGGNFGVVTSFEYQLHPVKDVYGGPIFFELDRGRRRCSSSTASSSPTAPEEMGAFSAFQIAPPLPFIPEDRARRDVLPHRGVLGRAARRGREGRSSRSARRRRSWPSSSRRCRTRRSTRRSTRCCPPGLQHYWKASFVTELTDGAIAAHLEHGPEGPDGELDDAHLPDQRRRATAWPSDATAFAYRDANFATVIAGMWPDPADNEKNTAWVRDYYAATRAALGDRRLRQLHGRATTRTRSATTTGATTTGSVESRGSTTRATCST